MSKNIRRSKVKQFWQNLMHSPKKKLSRGSSNICRMISWARSENWRINDRSNRKASKKK